MSTITLDSHCTPDLGELLPVVAHDLRAPLASILGYVGLVLADAGDALGPEQRRYLRIVCRDAERALRLANDLLTFDALEHGVELDLGSVDLAQLAAECAETMEPRAIARSISLTVEIEAEAVVLGDAQRLAQVFDNLVGNAIAYTRPGRDVTIAVGCGSDGNWLAVRDTGPGIPPEQQEQLFQRFVRGHSPDSGRPLGTGLGLSIVRSIVEAHGGHVRLESEVGVGSTFAAEGLRPAASTGRRTALLVEDGTTMRKVAEHVLRDAGFVVLAAPTPAEALDVMAAYDGEIDVVVSDFVMPGMDGLDLLRRVRAARPDIHAVLFSTATLGPELLESVGALYVAKPFTAASLVAAVMAASADLPTASLR